MMKKAIALAPCFFLTGCATAAKQGLDTDAIAGQNAGSNEQAAGE